jgi:DNA modification methylase
VALVAEKLGRDSVLVEIKPEFAQMARERLKAELGELFTVIETAGACEG